MQSVSPSIYVPRRVCADPAAALRHEWLVTNGIGGFACGTIAGALTRRYHGLLIAALDPPLGRTLTATKLDETLHVGAADGPAEAFALHSNVWKDGIEEPAGCRLLSRFDLVLGVPTWEYRCGPARLTKRIWMEYGRNTTWVQYDLHPDSPPSLLTCRLLVNYRDYHALTPADQRRFGVERVAGGLRINAGPDARPQYALAALVGVDGESATCDWTPAHDWFRDFDLPFEASVGYEHREDHLCAGVCRGAVMPGGTLRFAFSVETDIGDHFAADAGRASPLSRFTGRARQTIAAWREQCPTPIDQTPAALPQLALAADQFVVRRAMPDAPDGHTVIAGYPWFTDWGRDTMISLPGLTLCTGRFDVARQILRTWARVVDRGMIPNRFPDASDRPEYNTADATLWYLWAIGRYYEATRDRDTLGELFPVMNEIIDWHRRGTRYGIQMDDDGLIYAGQPGVNLTWMDAKIGDYVVTPRIGKPVELSALWYCALRNMARFAADLDLSCDDYAGLAERTRASFERFWNPQRNCCLDIIDAPAGAAAWADCDPRVQANQIFAVSLEHSALSPAQQQSVVDTVERELLTWFGLRTLSPGEPRYHGRYEGRLGERDEAYHQGTAWGWLLGPFVIAHFRVHGDAAAARRFLGPMFGQLWTHGIGSLAEIFDGDQPHTPRGCVAQAWSVAETLRAWHVTQSAAGPHPTAAQGGRAPLT